MMEHLSLNDANATVICLCSNDEEIDNFRGQLNHSVISYKTVDSCIEFIQSNESKSKTLLIVFHEFISEILSNISIFKQVDYLFIYYSKPNDYKYIYHEELNITGIYDQLGQLCSSIKEELDLIDEHNSNWIFYDPKQTMERDLSKNANDFLWVHLFHELICYLPQDDLAKRQFTEHFPSENLNDSMIRKVFENALREQNIDELYQLRYFLASLIEDINAQHEQLPCLIYQSIKLSPKELTKFCKYKSKLLLYKGFLSGKENSPREYTDVILEIECNVNHSRQQEDILFDFNTTFKIEHVQQVDQQCLIRLKTVNDGFLITQKYIQDTRRHWDDWNISIIFGKFLFDMCQWNRSQNYFQHLKDDYSSCEDLAWIEQSIGQTLYWRCQWEEARIHFDQAYDRMTNSDPPRIKDSAIVLHDIAEIFRMQGKLDDSYEFHERALEIRKKFYSGEHPLMADSFEYISFVHRRWNNNAQALNFLEQALAIREKYYQHLHFDIARNLYHIHGSLIDQNEHNRALSIQERITTIYADSLPPVHWQIVEIMLSMSLYSLFQRKLSRVLEFAIKSFDNDAQNISIG
ncbi:unnamed protein product [Adineta ricciae]|uniref:Uncharacterized protein n=1 Tax=Adineta ricciae TaxID=249248 RepID=A0A815LD32_ADIRI|nr:unnamed protein product [Adineta ricciae]CAF1488007.1 unnamed protein product [Adineta ricciae]